MNVKLKLIITIIFISDSEIVTKQKKLIMDKPILIMKDVVTVLMNYIN